jgi:hypothetical protein
VITRGISPAFPGHDPAEEGRSAIPFPHRASAGRTADDALPNHLYRGNARGSGARSARAGLMKTHTWPTWQP